MQMSTELGYIHHQNHAQYGVHIIWTVVIMLLNEQILHKYT